MTIYRSGKTPLKPTSQNNNTNPQLKLLNQKHNILHHIYAMFACNRVRGFDCKWTSWGLFWHALCSQCVKIDDKRHFPASSLNSPDTNIFPPGIISTPCCSKSQSSIRITECFHTIQLMPAASAAAFYHILLLLMKADLRRVFAHTTAMWLTATSTITVSDRYKLKM